MRTSIPLYALVLFGACGICFVLTYTLWSKVQRHVESRYPVVWAGFRFPLAREFNESAAEMRVAEAHGRFREFIFSSERVNLRDNALNKMVRGVVTLLVVDIVLFAGSCFLCSKLNLLN